MDNLLGLVILIILFVFAILMTLGLMLLKKSNPSFELEEDLGIGKIHLNAEDLQYLVGKEGQTLTELKPWGKCRIDGIEFSVKAEMDYVAADEKVYISRIHGNRIIVREQEKG